MRLLNCYTQGIGRRMQTDIGGAYKTQTNTLSSRHYRAGSHRRAGGKGENATAGKPTDAPTEVAQIKGANPIFSVVAQFEGLGTRSHPTNSPLCRWCSSTCSTFFLTLISPTL